MSDGSEKELVGVDYDVDFKGGKAVVKLVHVGKVGSVKLEGELEAKPFINKFIDKLEELIPGDQKIHAALLKAAVEKLEF
jgi:hypothetical protein